MPSTMILEYFGAELVGGELLAARFAINFAVSTIVSRAFAAQPGMSQTSDSGTRQQVPPSNTNSIPVVYGTAYMGGTFVDAVLSTDQQTMYYVMAISHATEGGSHSFDLTKMYYGDQLITFNTPTPEQTSVISLTDTAGNVDTKIANNLSIYLYYANEAGTITGYNTNYMPWDSNVMGNTGIDAALRWPSTGRRMNGLMFAIVKLKYNRDAGTTSLSPITFNLTNTAATVYNKPGDVWYDYLTNTKYGAAMDASIVDTVSRDALNTYAAATIPYTPSGGGSATQARYTINGVIDTSKDCLTNLDQIMLACDSWNQYNATTGKWAIVINKEETTSFAFDDSNIVGDIRISAQDITQSINQIEAQFPNSSNKDQQDFVYIQTPSNLLYVNEPVNKYTIKYELVNNSVQAQYLANRQLEQAREDLIVSINTPYPGIQVDAGDVVSITNAFYGWDAKLFRVMKVVESASPEGGLGASLDLTEYNAQVYDNASITAFTPAPNSNLSSPNYFSALTVPSISATYTTVTVPNFNISVSIPSIGRVTGIRVFYSVAGAADWKVLAFEFKLASTPFTPGSTFVFKDLVLPSGTYDFSYTVLNDIGGSAVSPTLSSYVWATYPSKIGTNLVSSSNVVQTSYDVNNQYGGTPNTNYIGNWQQTTPGGVGLNLQSPNGDSTPLRLYAGVDGYLSTVYPHMAMIPLTYGLPTSSINGGITFMSGHLYTNNGSSWSQVYQVGDTITPTFTAQYANTVLAGPTSGAAAVPTFRTLVAADVPTLNQNTTGYAASLNNGSNYLVQAYSEGSGLFLSGWDISAPAAISTALRFSNVTNGILGHILYDASGAGFKFYDAATGYTPITASVITGTRLVSTIATGTAPLTVSSTTRVSNLNVATAGTADALLNGNRQAIAGTYAWDSWNFYSNSASLSSINLLTRTGTWLAQLYADGVSTGFLAAYGAGTFDLEKVINGNLYIRVAGLQLTVLSSGNYGSYALPLTGGTLTGQLSIAFAGQVYLYLNPGNGYEAMVRYNGGSGSSWYVGKRMASQLVGTADFHFYSEATGATVAGIDAGGSIYARSNLYFGNTSSYAFGASYWAGTGGYPGYQFTGGNSRFGFSSTSGYVDVYTDGNFYAGIDINGLNNLVLHTGNYTTYAASTTGTTSASFITAGNATWGGKIQLGGNGGGSGVANTAIVQATNGNLHLDAGSGNATYINYYQGYAVYFGNGATGYNASISSSGYFSTSASMASVGLNSSGLNIIYNNAGNSYNEGIRLPRPGGSGYCCIAMGSDTSSNGTITGQWNLLAYPSYEGYKYAIRYVSTDCFTILNNGKIITYSGVGTGNATPGGFFGSSTASKFYNGSDISELLIESGSGSAILELSASAGSDWHIQVNTSGYLSIVQTSVAEIMRFNGSAVSIYGSLSKYSGTFDIPHPTVYGKNLRHSFIEGPRVDLIYRGHATLVDGMAVLNMDTDAVSDGGQTMTPGTFEALTRDADIFVQNQTGWEPVRATLSGATLTIVCKDLTSKDTVSWMVVAERKDQHLYDSDTSITDAQARMILEYDSPTTNPSTKI